MNYIDQVNVGGTSYTAGLPNVYINEKGNLNIETSATIGNTPANKGKINIEATSDIQFKPGDDVIFYSHHRAEDKRDEVAVKVTDGDDVPVKLQVNAAELLLTTKDKPANNNPDVLDISINSNTNTRGYLKVRAQAIDLRCEKHGGVALQPKGYDGEGHMNKIKFEHGGGDGLEFGTFNTEKTSLFTDEYRFNKDGVWKMATRETIPSGKTIRDEGAVPVGKQATAALKYVKQDDDFYDIIDSTDAQCTTENIIKTANAFNYGKSRHTKITNKGNIEIATEDTYIVVIESEPESPAVATEISTISTEIAGLTVAEGDVFNAGDFDSDALPVENTVYTNGTQFFSFTKQAAPSINIESGNALKLSGILNFGSNFNFGETDEGIEFQYKLTKKNAEKDCGVLKVVGVNNHASNNLTVDGVTIAPGQTGTIAQCSVLDIIKLVNYMKTNNQGPWSQL